VTLGGIKITELSEAGPRTALYCVRFALGWRGLFESRPS